MSLGTALVVEDEENIASLVRAYLQRDGYRVVCVASGAEAIAAVDRERPQIVVLDLGLPDIDGFEVCRRIRTRSAVPILMLTARDEEADRVAGLEIGADDYLAKPFSPRELMARVKAILRRTHGRAGDRRHVLTLGDIVVAPAAREVTVAGAPVELRAKEFDLLVHLIENRGVVLSRDRLLEDVWSLEFEGGTRTVDVHIAQLRAKLGRPKAIRTLRGAGYKAVEPPTAP
jgi:DNA-binding response OmpR family regulator